MILDLLVVLITGYGFYTGYRKGIIDTVFDAVSILVAILVSLKLSPLLISLLNDKLNLSPGLGFIIGFVATFFIAMLLIRFIGNKLEGIFKAVNLNFINKIAGGVLMGIVYATIFSFLVGLTGQLNLLPADIEEKSSTYGIVKAIPETSKGIFKTFKPIFSEFWDKTVETIDTVKEKAEQNG